MLVFGRALQTVYKETVELYFRIERYAIQREDRASSAVTQQYLSADLVRFAHSRSVNV